MLRYSSFFTFFFLIHSFLTNFSKITYHFNLFQFISSIDRKKKLNNDQP